MAILEIKSGIATKEFELKISKDMYYLSICAYGDFFMEEFKQKEDLEEYLKSVWNFSTEQIEELINKCLT